MNRLNMTDVRCAALFASGLQQSDAPTAAVVAEAVQRTMRQFGVRGCAGRMAQEFGDHPETAMDRMRWVRQLVGRPEDLPMLRWLARHDVRERALAIRKGRLHALRLLRRPRTPVGVAAAD